MNCSWYSKQGIEETGIAGDIFIILQEVTMTVVATEEVGVVQAKKNDNENFGYLGLLS